MTDELQPGRELDARIATTFFLSDLPSIHYTFRGALYGFWCPGCGSNFFRTPDIRNDVRECKGCGRLWTSIEACPRYSKDIEAAWPLVRKLGERWLLAFDGLWHVRAVLCVTHQEDNGEVTYAALPIASGISVPHVLCLAALQTAATLPVAAPPRAA